MTVVARGAAIFAGTQIIPKKLKGITSISAEQLQLELDYQPIGDTTEPTIGGRVIVKKGQSLEGYTIEFVEAKTAWRSGKIEINQYGGFTSKIVAEKNCRNEYLVELKDSKGNQYSTVPDRFIYTVGITVSAQTIVNNIVIAQSNNSVVQFFEKGISLPQSHRKTDFRTTTALKHGDPQTIVKIPIVEGQNERANRNHLIGFLKICGNEVTRDVPLGSEIEITLHMDESRIITMHIYIPILDKEFEKVFDSEYEIINENEVANTIKNTKKRLEEIQNQNQKIRSNDADRLLNQIEDEHIVDEINSMSDSVQQHDIESLDRVAFMANNGY
jgi:molecular chaperone DnaK